MEQKTFTGYRRKSKTRLSVRLADRTARQLIIIGGIGTIVAVCTVCVFLVYVALPLFSAPEVKAKPDLPAAVDDRPVHLASDEHRVMGWTVCADGRVDIFRLDTGELLEQHDLDPNQQLSTLSVSSDGQTVTLAFKDGTVRTATIDPNIQLLPDQDVPDSARTLSIGQVGTIPNGLIVRLATGFRRHRIDVTEDDPIELTPGQPITLIYRIKRSTGPVFCALTENNELVIRSARQRRNLLTGEVTTTLSGGNTTLDMPVDKGSPDYLLMTPSANTTYVVWKDGTCLRLDTRNFKDTTIAESLNLIGSEGHTLTSLTFLLGQETLLAADDSGTIRAWFRTRTQTGKTSDGWTLVCAHTFHTQHVITTLACSQRTRLVLAGDVQGSWYLFHVTTDHLLVQRDNATKRPLRAVAIAPKDNGILALDDQALHQWTLDVKYPEATASALFLPVWYEGQPKPMYVWQSSSSNDAFEPKLGLMPLIFGTLKATFYSLLFGVPLALLAAIYSSEFLHPKHRARIKPVIELMASLPSVVLGFLAALVIAPFVEDKIPTVLTALVTVPIVWLLGARLWQLLPRQLSLRWEPFRLIFIGLALLAGILWAIAQGPLVERWLFNGDIIAWLNELHGTGTGGWMIILLPLCSIAIALILSFYVNPFIKRLSHNRTHAVVALLDLFKFLIAVVVTLVTAWLLSTLLTGLGWDPRGGNSFLGTYVQRNALVVGFVMGFAIIPIIYTIAEDALSTVPDHLRAASLGAGATPWQTALRIVIPTAMSGLFSAIMIGLGRAVGETMIVLMAGGNTPIMEWNIFNGIRTLSANIAVELPEAPQHGTLYRTLFLSALVLFAMTFVINTVAEFVRLRFRKRAYQL